jgi:hypothetical protein
MPGPASAACFKAVMSSHKSRGVSGMATSPHIARTTKPPNGSNTGAHHKKRRAVQEIFGGLRCLIRVEILRAGGVGACGRRSCSRATRSMTKSPSSGRSKRRAVLELIPCCRCGVLFPKTNGRKEKRFCSNECRAEEPRFCSKHCSRTARRGNTATSGPAPERAAATARRDGLRDRRAPPPGCTPEDAH